MTSSLVPSGLSGVQEPRLRVEPAAVDDYASEAAALASSYGLTPDPWQELVLRAWLGVREDGKWASSRCGLSVPRQNGKNALIEIRELFGMVGLGEKILHTAHEVKTARKAFIRLCSFFDNPRKYPELAELVAPGGIRRTNGQEAILLTNGGSVEFVARSKGSARGFTVDVVVMDEAQEMSDDALEALGPTTAAAPLKNRQMIWTGTPPSPGMTSEVFTRIRSECLDGSPVRMCWHEWSIEPGADLDDPAAWAQANPALGVRVGVEELAEDRSNYSDEGFARERGGMWEAAATSQVIQPEWWSELADPNFVDSGGAVTIALDVSPDRSMASVVGATLTTDGRVGVNLLESRKGSPEWVVPFVLERLARNHVKALVIDRAGPAANLIDLFSKERVQVTGVDVDRAKRSAATFFDAVVSGQLVHMDQPTLNVAVANGRKRKLSDGWAWSRSAPDADITSLVAASMAVWAMSVPDTKRLRHRTGRNSSGREGAVVL